MIYKYVSKTFVSMRNNYIFDDGRYVPPMVVTSLIVIEQELAANLVGIWAGISGELSGNLSIDV